MPPTNYYVRPTNGANVAGQGTTHASAYLTTQFALDDIGGTHGRDAVNGDQINLCDESADTLAAPLSLAIYGAPTAGAPIIIRGYPVLANDGGVGEINCGGATMWLLTTYDSIHMIELLIHSFGNNPGIYLDNDINLNRCEVHNQGGGAAGKNTVQLDAGVIVGCHLHDPGATGVCIYCTQVGGIAAIGNYIEVSGASSGIYTANAIGSIFTKNIITCSHTSDIGIDCTGTGPQHAIGNIIYSSVANTQFGIRSGNAANRWLYSVVNNIVCGFSGVGGTGIVTAGHIGWRGYNAFWNNTANYTAGAKVFVDDSANDVALGADPFVNAAGGNFALTDVAKAALRSAGWPSSYLGASTDPHITIGVVQYGEAGAPVAGGRKYVFW